MKNSLSKISFYSTALILISFSVLLALFIYRFSESYYQERIVEMEKSYFDRNKKLVKNEVQRKIQQYVTLKEVMYKNAENMLSEKVDFVEHLINHHKDNSDIRSIVKKHEIILDSLKWDQGTGYFYIFDRNGTFLYHGADKTNENTNIWEVSKNYKNLNDFLRKSLDQNSLYGSYEWFQPGKGDNALFEKFVYIKKDDRYDVYIAAGMYKDKLKEKILEIFYKDLVINRFGEKDYGYFWVNGLDNIMKLHPINPEIVGKSLDDMVTSSGKPIFKAINSVASNGGGFVEYEWYRPDNLKIDTKQSYVAMLDEDSLVIGAGFYMSELTELYRLEKEKLRSLTNENIINMMSIQLVLTLLVMLLAKYISMRIEATEKENLEQTNMLKQYKFLLDKSSVVSKTDVEGKITYVNAQFTKVSGFTNNELLGRTHQILRHPETPKVQYIRLWDKISQGKIWKGIIKNKKKNGESFYNSTTIVPIKDSEGNIVEYISSGTDVTELIENRTKLQSLFKTDTLTGLGNRVSMIDLVSKKDKGVLGLINIDRFKEVNDSYSHTIGDEVIKEFASRLFNFFDERHYSLYRMQADVFGIFSDNHSIDKVIQEITAFINTIGIKEFNISNNTFILTYTCGVASNSDNLLTYADIALAEAKNKRVKILAYDPSMSNIEQFRNNIQWVERLHIAIREKNVIPYYQPIFNYNTGKIEKYEALMRIREGDKIIFPNEFLAIAKKTRLYPELTYTMVEHVLRKFTDLDLEFSINLSVEDLMNEELMIFLYDYAEQKNVFKRMVLEIVESEEIQDSDQVIKLIKKFKARGTKIAIDDFGSGYSNYEYLLILQADYLKIDGSIIKLIVSDSRTLDVVKSILEFAKKSHMKTIAEFVSDEHIDTLLREIGVDYAQGFYHGKPEAEFQN